MPAKGDAWEEAGAGGGRAADTGRRARRVRRARPAGTRRGRPPDPARVRWALAALRPVGALLAPLGVDARALREIVATRLRVLHRTRRGRVQTGEVLGALALAALGLGLGWLAGEVPSAFVWSSAAVGLVALLALFVLLQEGAAILFDPTDAAVVAALPVGGRTLFAGRLVLAGAALGVPVGIPVAASAAVAATVHPPAAALLLHPALCALACLGVLGAFGAAYGALLRSLGPTRMQRFVTGAQVLGGALAYGVLLALSRARESGAVSAVIEEPLLALLLPPANLGALYGAALGEEVPALAGHAALALALPALALVAALALVSRELGRALLGRTEALPRRAAGWPAGALARLNVRVNDPGPARAGFDLAVAVARRDTAFVRAGYGTLAMNAVLIAFIVAGEGDAFPARLGTAFATYMLAGQLPALLYLATHGPEPAALLPLRALDPRGLRRYQAGALRGLVLGIAAPLLVAVAGVLVLLQGPAALPDALLAACIGTAMLLRFARTARLAPLFTQGPLRGHGTTDRLGMALGFLITLPAGLLLHAPFFLHPLAPLAGIPLFAALAAREVRALEGVRPDLLGARWGAPVAGRKRSR